MVCVSVHTCVGAHIQGNLRLNPLGATHIIFDTIFLAGTNYYG